MRQHTVRIRAVLPAFLFLFKVNLVYLVHILVQVQKIKICYYISIILKSFKIFLEIPQKN